MDRNYLAAQRSARRIIGWLGAAAVFALSACGSNEETINTDPTNNTLQVHVVGSGTITSNPSGIDCTSDCTASYASATSVTLTAVAGNGYGFSGWSVSGVTCPGTDPCVVPMSAARTVTATFTQSSYSLTVQVNGSGTVTSAAGINCGTDCSELIAAGTSITLSATAASGYVFNGWSGSGVACAGTATCTVPMTAEHTVFATFSPVNASSYALEVHRVGAGTISSSPAGINCGSDCVESYAAGTNVTLTASAASGYSFSGWSINGVSCAGTTPCAIAMTAARTVTATFTQDPPTNYTLAVQRGGNGAGTVTSNISGINCGSVCEAPYTSATSVVLTAVAANGSTFTGWSGSDINCSGTGTCTVPMSANRMVTATFSTVPASTYALTVNVTGGGTVSSAPSGIDNCSSNCNHSYSSGVSVRLTASVSAGNEFRGWSGVCTGSATTCDVVMTGAKSVSAMFAAVGAAKSIPLSLIDPVTNSAFPVSSAVPFPRGALTSLDNLRLVNGNGQEVPAQFSKVAGWSDNSLKSVAVDFLAQPGVVSYQLYYGNGVTHASNYTTDLALTQDTNQIVVSNGTLRFAINKNRFTIFDQVWLDRNNDGVFETAMLSGPGEIVAVGNYGNSAAQTFSSAAQTSGYQVSIEEQGPTHITVLAKGKLQGPVANSDGDPTLTDFEIRLHFYAGSGLVRMFYTLIDAKPRDMSSWHLRSFPPRNKRVLDIKSLDLVLPLAVSASTYAAGGQSSLLSGAVGSNELYLLQDAGVALTSKIAYNFDYSGIGNGTTAKGWFDISGTNGGVSGGMRWFWQQFPKELRYNPSNTQNGKFVISLQPARSDRPVPWEIAGNNTRNTLYSLYPGIAKTFELYYQFHAGDRDAAHVVDVGDAFQRPPILFNSHWFTTSGVFGPLVPTAANQQAYDQKTAGAWDFKDRIGFSDGPNFLIYGNRDFGDYRRGIDGGQPEFMNHHYEDPRADLLQFLRSGERKWLDSAEVGARHHMDWDVMHVDNIDNSSDVNTYMRGNGPGMIHNHASYEHEQGGGAHEGHIVPGGLAENYLFSGDKRTLQVIKEQGDWIYNLANKKRFDMSLMDSSGNPVNYFEEQRSHGWTLHSVMESYLATGDAKYLNAASIIVANSIWWWKHPHAHIVLSPDTSRWPNVNETLNWQTGNSAWITNMRTDNCGDGNFTVSSWMAQYLIWGHVQWLSIVKDEMGLPAYSFSGTYLGNTTLNVAEVETMLLQNMKFIVDYQWLDTAYTVKYPWMATRNDHQFMYSPCRTDEGGSPDGMEVLPYLLYQLAPLLPSGTGDADRTKWIDVADKQYKKEFIDSTERAACGYGYNGAPCMLTVPYYLGLRFGTQN
ncbi:MAG: hypothetical protein HY308_16595 [Gammaproteobacteria bacterium]|nr:hypothetical protein [Gammaproteobacteria bacterium]